MLSSGFLLHSLPEDLVGGYYTLLLPPSTIKGYSDSMFPLLANSLWTQLLQVAAQCRKVSATAERSKRVQKERTQSALGADTYSNTNKENNNRKWKQSQQRQRKGQRAGQSKRKRERRKERVVTTAGRATARRALGLGSIDC